MKTTHNPPLQERPEAINARSVDIAAYIFVGAVIDGFMGIIRFQVMVAEGVIAGDQGNIIGYGAANEAIKSCLAGIINDLGNNHALTGDSTDNGDLTRGATAFLSFTPMAILVLAADVGFIYFNFAGKGSYIIALHGSSPAMAHIPACAVVRAGVLTKNHAVDLQGADSFLAGQHQVSDLKPKLERDFGVLEDRMRDDREAIAITPATVGGLANPIERASLESVDFITVTARTADTVRPSHINEELAA